MKIQLLSDLHLETQPHVLPAPAPEADLLILAGDIGSYQRGSKLSDPDFGLARFSPLPEYGNWPVPVVFVPGNHEFDSFDVTAAGQRLRETCKRLGITMLDQDVMHVGRVRFVGATLWSDFDALAQPVQRPTDQEKNDMLRGKGFRAAEFYLRKTGSTYQGEPFLGEAIRTLALQTQDWLRDTLHQPHDGPTVVITHFAPSLRSADPRYGVNPGTAGFCNSLDPLIPYADLWLHGHVHCPCDYVVSGLRHGARHDCRVVANPLGYAHKGEQEGFRDRFVIDVPDHG